MAECFTPQQESTFSCPQHILFLRNHPSPWHKKVIMYNLSYTLRTDNSSICHIPKTFISIVVFTGSPWPTILSGINECCVHHRMSQFVCSVQSFQPDSPLLSIRHERNRCTTRQLPRRRKTRVRPVSEV